MYFPAPAHSYRAILIPPTVCQDEVVYQAEQGLLPTIRLRAPDAARAMADAHRVTGHGVFDVERVAPEVTP